MRMRTLGGTGIQVSTYCLGAMMFGGWGNPDHEDSIRIIHTALDGGINFIDTADVYSRGESEEIVGKALKGRRDEVVLREREIHLHPQVGERRAEVGRDVRLARAAGERLGRSQVMAHVVRREDLVRDLHVAPVPHLVVETPHE